MLLLLNLAACPPLARSADLPQPEYYRWGAQLQVAAAAAEAHRIASSGAAHRQAGLQGQELGFAYTDSIAIGTADVGAPALRRTSAPQQCATQVCYLLDESMLGVGASKVPFASGSPGDNRHKKSGGRRAQRWPNPMINKLSPTAKNKHMPICCLLPLVPGIKRQHAGNGPGTAGIRDHRERWDGDAGLNLAVGRSRVSC